MSPSSLMLPVNGIKPDIALNRVVLPEPGPPVIIDKDEFIQDVIDTDGYGHTINSYDGSADEVTIQDQLFYVMRID